MVWKEKELFPFCGLLTILWFSLWIHDSIHWAINNYLVLRLKKVPGSQYKRIEKWGCDKYTLITLVNIVSNIIEIFCSFPIILRNWSEFLYMFHFATFIWIWQDFVTARPTVILNTLGKRWGFSSLYLSSRLER